MLLWFEGHLHYGALRELTGDNTSRSLMSSELLNKVLHRILGKAVILTNLVTKITQVSFIYTQTSSCLFCFF